MLHAAAAADATRRLHYRARDKEAYADIAFRCCYYAIYTALRSRDIAMIICALRYMLRYAFAASSPYAIASCRVTPLRMLAQRGLRLAAPRRYVDIFGFAVAYATDI